MTIRTPQASGSPAGSPDGHPPGELRAPGALAAALEAWFAQAARALPWRQERTGYRALVSEVMLQQTQVQRVAPAFERFLAEFPTVADLAAAPEQRVLAAWQGLGYYRRARLLHAAARAIEAEHAGVVPAHAGVLRGLPGVGRYTAGAIASIVFGAREPIVDGNVLRVLARLEARPGPADAPDTIAWAWQQAERLVAAAPHPGATNEALMELGATVCTPALPRCDACPLAGRCAARASGTPGAFPAPKAATPRRTVHWHALVVASAGEVLLEQRGDRGLWARMWQVPTVEAVAPRAVPELEAHWQTSVRPLGEFVHTTTHRLVCFRVFAAGAPVPAAPGQHRVATTELATYPLANAMWRVLELAGVGVSPPPSAAGRRRGSRGVRAAPTAATDS